MNTSGGKLNGATSYSIIMYTTSNVTRSVAGGEKQREKEGEVRERGRGKRRYERDNIVRHFLIRVSKWDDNTLRNDGPRGIEEEKLSSLA